MRVVVIAAFAAFVAGPALAGKVPVKPTPDKPEHCYEGTASSAQTPLKGPRPFASVIPGKDPVPCYVIGDKPDPAKKSGTYSAMT